MTIRELARRSGVSVGTVSRALNGYADVSAETRERIERLARELDYTPTAAARTLVTGRSNVLGVFLETGDDHPDLQHPFFHEVMVGFKELSGSAGYDLLLFAAEPGSYLKRCREYGVAGTVLMGVDGTRPAVRELAAGGLPCVGVDLELPGPNFAWVTSDNVLGARLAVRHLHRLGHRRIATIAGLLDSRPGADRLRGYREEIAAQGLQPRVARGDFYAESGRRAMAALLALDEPPTAVFAASDMMALGAIREAGEAGVAVPGDLSVVGFDDMVLSAHVNPPLTTIRQDKAGLGAAAATALIELIEGAESARTRATVLPVALLERASTAAWRPHLSEGGIRV